MALLGLKRLMSLQRGRQRRHRQIRTRNGSIAWVNKRKGSPCQEPDDGDSQAGKITRCSIPDLPEDILRHIHSRMPLCDAARAACVSHAFLRFWRCHPILILDSNTLGPNENEHPDPESFIRKIDHIMRNHSGVGIKIFKLELYGAFDARHYLNNWLQIAVTPGIEQLILDLCHEGRTMYRIPCSLLSDGVRDSLQCLQLDQCVFRPTAELGPLRNLKWLGLCSVKISGDELECLLAKSPALEQLYLHYCDEIICLEIPSVLQQLRVLKVSYCSKLRIIVNEAPNLSSFDLQGDKVKEVSLGETLQMKSLSLHRSNLLYYARTELPSRMPNLETLAIGSQYERVSTPMLPTKFLFLKLLDIDLGETPSYDYFSLVSFLDAAPVLEKLVLDVCQEDMRHESVFDGSSQLRQMPEHHHGCLKEVHIKGFNSARSLVELTCYILMNAKSLEYLALDTTYDPPRCDSELSGGICPSMNQGFLMESFRAVAAIREYIEDKVPTTVELKVVEHCRKCYADSYLDWSNMQPL